METWKTETCTPICGIRAIKSLVVNTSTVYSVKDNELNCEIEHVSSTAVRPLHFNNFYAKRRKLIYHDCKSMACHQFVHQANNAFTKQFDHWHGEPYVCIRATRYGPAIGMREDIMSLVQAEMHGMSIGLCLTGRMLTANRCYQRDKMYV